jgi:hypothetical protein
VHVAISLCGRFSHDPRSISIHVFSLSFLPGRSGLHGFSRATVVVRNFLFLAVPTLPDSPNSGDDPSQIMLALLLPVIRDWVVPRT